MTSMCRLCRSGTSPGTWKREDLPCSVGQDLVAANEAFDDEAALRGPVAFADDVLVRAKMSDRNRQIQESLRLFLGKRSTYDAFELLDESIWRRFGHLDGPVTWDGRRAWPSRIGSCPRTEQATHITLAP